MALLSQTTKRSRRLQRLVTPGGRGPGGRGPGALGCARRPVRRPQGKSGPGLLRPIELHRAEPFGTGMGPAGTVRGERPVPHWAGGGCFRAPRAQNADAGVILILPLDKAARARRCECSGLTLSVKRGTGHCGVARHCPARRAIVKRRFPSRAQSRRTLFYAPGQRHHKSREDKRTSKNRTPPTLPSFLFPHPSVRVRPHRSGPFMIRTTFRVPARDGPFRVPARDGPSPCQSPAEDLRCSSRMPTKSGRRQVKCRGAGIQATVPAKARRPISVEVWMKAACSSLSRSHQSPPCS